jgi:hypothetical protein
MEVSAARQPVTRQIEALGGRHGRDAHSWHPVPVPLHSAVIRPDGIARFTEAECAQGGLGLRPGLHLMGLALANAGRMRKFGA